MYKTILKINGMKCGMCQSHLNDIIRKNFEVKKVKSSFRKNITIITSKEVVNIEKIKEVIKQTGYIVEDYIVEE